MIALLPHYEKEAMGVIVGLGGLLGAGLLLLSRRVAAAAAAVVVGVGIAVASVTVNVENETYWGSLRDKAIFAGWSAVVAALAVLATRRVLPQRRERLGGPNSRSAQAGQ